MHSPSTVFPADPIPNTKQDATDDKGSGVKRDKPHLLWGIQEGDRTRVQTMNTTNCSRVLARTFFGI